MTLPTWMGRYTRARRLVQIGFLAAFVLLPLFDLVRFDFPAKKLFLFRHEVWLDEWTILWLALMLGMWVIGALTLVLGRVWCAWACPQTVFTELAHDIDVIARRLTKKLSGTLRARTQAAVAWTLVALLSLAATVLFMGYFDPLPDVLRRLARLDVGLWVGAVGAATTLIGFLNLAFVREGFCRSVCPYGLLQGVLEDGRSLHVRFDEAGGKCIDCGACVTVCPMAIDIRLGSYQIECTRCGSCIDRCEAVLGKRKRAGLLSFAMGAEGEAAAARTWDVKRVLVAAATGGFAVALVLAVATRETIAIHLAPVYTEAKAQGDAAESRFLLRAANRGRTPVTIDVAAEGLPAGAVVSGLGEGRVAAGTEGRFTIVVRVPRSAATSSVIPFSFVVNAGATRTRIPSSFYSPFRRTS